MKKLLVNVAIYSLIPQLPRVLSFFLLPLYTQFLSPTDYGISGIIYSVTGLFMGLGDLGLHIRQANSFFKSDKGWVNTWGRIYTLLHVWSFFLSIIQSVVLYFILPPTLQEWEKWVIFFVYFICNTVFATTINFCNRYYQYIEKPRTIVTTSAFISAFSLILNFAFIVWLKLGFMAWVFTYMITSMVNFVFAYYLFNVKIRFRPLYDLKARWLKANFKVSLPLVPHNYASYLLDASDRFMMKVMGVTTAKIGEYNFAYIVGTYFDFFVTAISLAAAPNFAKDYFRSKVGRDGLLFRKIMVIQLLLILIALLGTIWIKEAFRFLVNDQNPLVFTYNIAIIILWAYAFRPIYWLVNCVLTYNNITSSLWKITFTAGILSVVLNLLMIPLLGIIGAAWTTFGSMVIMSIMGLYFRKFAINFSRPVRGFGLLSLALATVLVFFSLWVVEQSFFIKAITTGVIVAASTIALVTFWNRINLIFSPQLPAVTGNEPASPASI